MDVGRVMNDKIIFFGKCTDEFVHITQTSVGIDIECIVVYFLAYLLRVAHDTRSESAIEVGLDSLGLKMIQLLRCMTRDRERHIDEIKSSGLYQKIQEIQGDGEGIGVKYFFEDGCGCKFMKRIYSSGLPQSFILI